MTVHIGAKENEIAETVLMPGDPLRAKFIAEKMLDNVHCYNQVRGMLGFTGTYKGKRVSIQGSGMGMPSMSIYATELITSYGAKNIIRIGSCGALQDQVNLRDIVIAQGACTDSSMNRIRFDGMDYAPIASFDLLHKSYQAAVKRGIRTHVGNIVSSDIFYDEKEHWQLPLLLNKKPGEMPIILCQFHPDNTYNLWSPEDFEYISNMVFNALPQKDIFSYKPIDVKKKIEIFPAIEQGVRIEAGNA